MKITLCSIFYLLGFFICMIAHDIHFETKKECKEFDGVQMCRSIHYSSWKEVDK